MSTVLRMIFTVLIRTVVTEVRALLADRREAERIRRQERAKIEEAQENARHEIVQRLEDRKRASRRDAVRRLRDGSF